MITFLDPHIHHNYTSRLSTAIDMLQTGQMPDENAVGSLKQGVRRVLLAQILIAAALVAGMWFWSGKLPGMSIGYGALLGLFGTLVTSRSVMRSSDSAASQPNLALLPVFSGMLQKLLIVALGIGAGIKILGLEALFMLLGLLASQIAFAVALSRPPN